MYIVDPAFNSISTGVAWAYHHDEFRCRCDRVHELGSIR